MIDGATNEYPYKNLLKTWKLTSLTVKTSIQIARLNPYKNLSKTSESQLTSLTVKTSIQIARLIICKCLYHTKYTNFCFFFAQNETRHSMILITYLYPHTKWWPHSHSEGKILPKSEVITYLENSVCRLWNSSWWICWYHVCELFSKITDVQFIANSRFKGRCNLLLSQKVPVKDLLVERYWSAIQQVIYCQWQILTNAILKQLNTGRLICSGFLSYMLK